MQRCLRSDVRTNNTHMIYVLYLASHSENAWHRRQYWWEIHVNLYFLNPWLVQGWPKRWTRGYVNLRWKSCVLLPAAGRRTQFLSLIFTEPGVHLLGHPCNTMVFLVTKPNAVIIGNYLAFNVKATSPLGGLYDSCLQKLEREEYRARLKGSGQVWWIWGGKIAFSCQQQAGKRNFFTSCSQNLAEAF